MSTAAGAIFGAVCIDFTGTVEQFRQLSGFGPELVSMVRNGAANKTLVIVDRAIGAPLLQPALVRDHLNLTGSNPLTGPNDASGARFPVVQGVYIEDALPELPRVVAAGLKPGLSPTDDDKRAMKDLGAHTACYNIIPSMLICAHAKWRVLALLVPQGQQLPADLLQALNRLIGGDRDPDRR